MARQAALNADFGRTPGLGFERLRCDFLGREEIGSLIARSDAESTEFASHKTDVGEIDVAGNNVADDVADQTTSDFVGRHNQSKQVSAFAAGEPNALFGGEDAAIERSENSFQRGA